MNEIKVDRPPLHHRVEREVGETLFFWQMKSPIFTFFFCFFFFPDLASPSSLSCPYLLQKQMRWDVYKPKLKSPSFFRFVLPDLASYALLSSL
jgi:hypothetical protein